MTVRMTSKCPKCKNLFKLEVIDQDTGKTDSKCPTCNEEIIFHCHNCTHELLVKNLYQCNWCSWFICDDCHECKPKCEGRTIFKYILQKSSSEKDPAEFLGFQNKRFFVLYQLMGNLGKLNVKRVCPRGNWYTAAQVNIPNLYGIVEGLVGKKDAKTYAARLEKWYKEVFENNGLKFNVEDFVEPGREGKEERDVVSLAVCLGAVELNPDYSESKKLYVVAQNPICPFFKQPVIIQKGQCPKCKRVIQGEYKECPICAPLTKGKNKGRCPILVPLRLKHGDLKICSCPIDQFKEKKVGDKNWNDRADSGIKE